MSFIVKRGRVVSVVDCSVWVGTVVVLDMPKISTQGFEFEYTVRIVPIGERNECTPTESAGCVGLGEAISNVTLGSKP